MKSILMSIQPKWCELIVSGQKTIEVRKTAPKEVPFKAFIYQTKKKWIYRLLEWLGLYQQKVIGEFICDKIYHNEGTVYDILAFQKAIMEDACLNLEELQKYSNGKPLYGYLITDLKIYDEPKALHHFFKPCGDCSKKDTMRCTEESTDCRATTITRPPQGWQYVQELED